MTDTPSQPAFDPHTFIAPDGTRLETAVWKGGNIPVLFLQGNGFPVQCYGPAIAPLLDRATVHGINLRGQGPSPYPAPIKSWNDHLVDLKAYLAENFTPPYYLAGHSMGAVLAMQLAGERPRDVAGLLLLEPPVPLVRNHPHYDQISRHLEGMAQKALDRRAQWNNREEARNYLSERGIYQGWSKECMDLFMAHGTRLMNEGEQGGVELTCTPSAEADAYRAHPGRGIFNAAEAVKTPVVMLRGESSDISKEALVELSGLLSISVLYTVSGGHAFPMQHPLDTGAVINDAFNVLLNKPGPFPAQ